MLPEVKRPQSVSPGEHRSFLLGAAVWQDNLLQSYRTISITLQSVLLAVAAVLLGATLQAHSRLSVSLLVSGLTMVVVVAVIGWRQMKGVIDDRATDATFWQKKIHEHEAAAISDSQRSFVSFKEEQEVRKNNAGIPGELIKRGLTRMRIDHHIQLALMACWLGVLLIGLAWLCVTWFHPAWIS